MKGLLTILTLFIAQGLFAQDLYQITLLKKGQKESQKWENKLYKSLDGKTDFLIELENQYWDLMHIQLVNQMSEHFDRGKNSISPVIKDGLNADIIDLSKESLMAGISHEVFLKNIKKHDYNRLSMQTTNSFEGNMKWNELEEENQFRDTIGMNPIMIFTEISGGSWKIFTLESEDQKGI